MSSHVYDYTEQDGTGTWTDITDYTYGLPGRHGIPTTPSLDTIPFEFTGYLRYIEFRNGGIGISCDDSVCLRGDINANGIRYEIADAVMYVNYFLSGIFAFGDHVNASIAASDVNNDGSTLSVGDLVLLIRIINGDAVPFNKSSTKGKIAVFPEVTDTMLTVVYEATTEAGAALLLFHVNGVIGSIRAGNGASSMSISYSQEEDELRLLIYDIGSHVINKGTDTLCIVPVHGTLELVDADVADYDGGAMEVSINQPVADFLLEQNHPNPFNPMTAILYCVPSQSHVTINVFNLLGQHVVTLVDEDKSPGTYRVVWDGTDQIGRLVATGVYLYRLQADDHVETRKMLLIK
jgi:hypothetical protein